MAAGRPVSFRVPEGRLLAATDEITFDVAFPVLHGPYGEDGSIQGAFEMSDTPFVGCGVTASALAMEKDFAKQIFSQQRIPTARWFAVTRDDFDNNPAAVVGTVVRQLGLPVFVKPAQLGSSVGVAKAATEGELKDAIRDALDYGDKAIVEEYIEGREIEVAVLGGKASVPGEIKIQSEWYDYDTKYNDDSSEFVAPARLTPPQSSTVRELAERAYAALGCKGLSRVDFFFEEQRARFLDQRGQHDARVHPDLGVPDHVAGERDELRGPLRRTRSTRVERRVAPRASYNRTTGQVRVLVIPSTAWMRATTSFPSESTSSASVWTTASYGPVTASLWVTPGISPIRAATSAALPTSVWIRT